MHHVRLQLAVPAGVLHEAVGGRGELAPALDRRRQAAVAGQAARPVEGHPGHQRGVGKALPGAADLPHPLVRLLPVLGQPVEPLGQPHPQVVRDRHLAVVEVDRVHQLAVDVDLPLVHGVVADPDGPGAPVALQMIEPGLRDLLAAVHRVHDHDVVLRGGGLAARLHPFHERRRFLQETQGHQRVDGEGGVPQPAVAVVPVPAAAQFLRQRRGGRGDQRPRRVVDEQLEGQRRPLHGFPPAAAVAGLADPVLPEVRGQREQVGGLTRGQRPDLAAPFQLDVHGLALVQGERGGHAGFLDLERDRGAQHAVPSRGPEHRADAGDHLDRVRGPAVVERRVTGQLERGPAADRPGLAHQQVTRLAGAAGLRDHEIDDLADRLGAVEPGEQDVGVRQVHLLRVRGHVAGQREVAALAGVQQRAEQRGGVEAGRAVPVHGAVGTDQGHGPQVPDDPVLLDRQVAGGRRPVHPVAGCVIPHTS